MHTEHITKQIQLNAHANHFMVVFYEVEYYASLDKSTKKFVSERNKLNNLKIKLTSNIMN